MMIDPNTVNSGVERPTKVMTVREVSAYLRVHPSTLYRLLKLHQVPAFRIGSDWRFNVEAIDRWCSQLQAHV